MFMQIYIITNKKNNYNGFCKLDISRCFVLLNLNFSQIHESSHVKQYDIHDL